MNIFFRCAIPLLTAALCGAQSSSMGTNSIVFAGDGYQTPSPALSVAPGQVITLHVHGIVTAIDSKVVATAGPSGYPLTLNGISVDLIQGKDGAAIALPLRAAYQTHCIEPCTTLTGITLQIPFELDSGFAALSNPSPYLRVSENGKAVGGVALLPVTDNAHVINTCDDTQIFISAASSVPQDVCADVVMGGNALNSLYNLAHTGDALSVWLFGMGAAAPGSANPSGGLAQSYQLNYDFRPNAPATPAVAGFGVAGTPLYAGHVGGGLYQVNLIVPPVPAGMPACDGVRIQSNLTVTISGPKSSAAARICVTP